MENFRIRKQLNQGVLKFINVKETESIRWAEERAFGTS
jgi:hypothetical protein